MKAVQAVHIFAVAALLLCSEGCTTTSTPPAPPDRQLTSPEDAADREYLGLAEGKPKFQLEEIRCEVLVIDCFDMYCHICQTGAKHVNELYRLVHERGLGARVKFVGLGLGDSPLEVATYKEKFRVPFPVFPDRRSAVAKQFGPVRLPNLIVLRKRSDSLEVINSSPGVLLNPSQVLSHIETALNRARTYRWNDSAQAAQPTCGSESSECGNPALSAVKTAAKGDANPSTGPR